MSSAKRVRDHRLKKKISKKVKSDFLLIYNESEVDNVMEDEDASEIDYENEDIDSEDGDNYFDSDDFSDYSDDSVSSNEHDRQALSHSEKDSEQKNSMTNEEPEVNLLRIWAVDSGIPKKHLDSLLKILKKRLLPSIPSCSKSFLRTSDAKYNIQTMKDSSNSLGEFCYLGITQGLRACVNPLLHNDKILRLDYNIDGVKIKKSSSKSMWPILCRIFYKPSPTVYKPFPVAIFYGNGKPVDQNKFLEDFVSEINSLQAKGIVIKSVHFSVETRAFICDTPARSQVKHCKGHMSFNGCERCNVTAYKVDHTTVYKEFGRKRTAEDFRSFTDVQHHTGASPLLAIEPKVNLVDQFVLDSMHLLYLGLMLRLFENWMTGDKQVKISVEQKKELDRRVNMLKQDIPKEFNRKIRPTSDYANYKAAEHRFFLLYCGPVVLKKVLNKELYEHFLLFHAACRLLSSQKATQYTTLSRDYLRRFVENASVYYGDKFVTLNVHNLVHLPDDVDNMQCNLNEISAFPFESELGKIKNVLLSPHRTISQYCRRVHEERQVLDQMAKVPQDISILNQKKGVVIQLMYKNQYFSLKHPDNSAILKNGKVIKINKIIKTDQKIYLDVVKYKILKSIFSSPCDSSLLEMYEVESTDSTQHSSIILLDDIRTKVIKMNMSFSSSDECRSFAVPLLH